MELKYTQDVRSQILDYLTDKGIKQSRLANALRLSTGGLHNILKCRSPLSDERLKEINEFLGTDFKKPSEPEETLLPHEKLEQDKEKAKKLFKE